MNMGIRTSVGLLAVVVAALLTIVLINSFERPPTEGIQRGFRGTGMVELFNPRVEARLQAANAIPASLPALPSAGAAAGKVYKNVQVLGSLSVGQFTRLMASITTWVSPAQGCAYCHDTKNMASDAIYTKVVARRMLQMVQYINSQWQPHVAATGVTCYTCHRGQPVPANIWFHNPGPTVPTGMAETQTSMGLASRAAGYTAMPFDPLTPFLEQDAEIRVQSQTALPTGDRQSIKQTEWTYALMMNFSQSLGVNCTYCHETRAFENWAESTPQRVTAWHGIRMVRSLNTQYMNPLLSAFPPERLGPTGDAPKINCATCHQGVFKPLYGVSMLKGFPELAGPLH